jgi:hypothetical protein
VSTVALLITATSVHGGEADLQNSESRANGAAVALDASVVFRVSDPPPLAKVDASTL